MFVPPADLSSGAIMSAIKFITFTDVHISSINPQSRLGDYEQDIFNKLDQIRRVGEKLDVDFYIFAGDLFNLKAPLKNPHSLNTKLITLFKNFSAPIYATEGNHDLKNDSYATFDKQPLKVIYSSGALKQVRDMTVDIKGIKVRLLSSDFEENPQFDKIFRKRKDEDISIRILHLYSAPEGGMFFKQQVYSYLSLSSLENDIYVLGHYHLDNGIEIRKNQDLNRTQIFINIGAISRGSLTEDEITRIPKIGLVQVMKEGSTINYKVNAARLNVLPADEVFDIKQKKEEKQKKKEAEEFVEKLQSELTDIEKGEDRIEKEVQKLDVEKEVLDKTFSFLQEADIYIKQNS